jgi:hypothetical protein
MLLETQLYVKAENRPVGRRKYSRLRYSAYLDAVTEMLAALSSSALLSGEHDLTRISDSGRMLPSHKERFARASIVMSLHSWQRIAMVDLWREFPITDASARGSAYAGGGG